MGTLWGMGGVPVPPAATPLPPAASRESEIETLREQGFLLVPDIPVREAEHALFPPEITHFDHEPDLRNEILNLIRRPDHDFLLHVFHTHLQKLELLLCRTNVLCQNGHLHSKSPNQPIQRDLLPPCFPL